MMMTQPTWDNLVNLVAQYAGLRVTPRDQAHFRRIVQQQMQSLRLNNVGEYYCLLATSVNRTPSLYEGISPQGHQAWHSLIQHLTIGESYFLRDARQLSLMRERLIPEILRRKSSQVPSQPLRFWSAGCATGEEVYSLAILLQELGLGQGVAGQLPEVVGTDLNKTFLAKATAGLYGEWSFRQTSAAFRQTYFTADKVDVWRVHSRLKALTQFWEFNLVNDPVSRLIGQGGKFDLIVCRNVFIYFTQAAITTTLAKFYEALNPGGYLITGHAELQGIDLGEFRVRNFPESIIYQRPIEEGPVGETTTTPKKSHPGKLATYSRPARPIEPSATPLPSTSASPPLSTVFIHQKIHPRKHPIVSTQSSGMKGDQPAEFNDHQGKVIATVEAKLQNDRLQRARQLANAGQYAAARALCQDLMADHPFLLEPCYLLANIAEETGDLDGAKIFLKRIIYLDPNAIPAYWALADLYERTQNLDRASKTRRSALTLLEQLPADHVLAIGGSLTVAELRQQLAQQLAAESRCL